MAKYVSNVCNMPANARGELHAVSPRRQEISESSFTLLQALGQAVESAERRAKDKNRGRGQTCSVGNLRSRQDSKSLTNIAKFLDEASKEGRRGTVNGVSSGFFINETTMSCPLTLSKEVAAGL